MNVKVRKTRQYVSISNSVLCDARLSWKAKGILCYLLSKPDNWIARIEDLYNQSTDGYNAVRSGINDLLLTGYMELRNEKDVGGQFTGRYYIVYEEPLFKKGYRLKENKSKLYRDDEPLEESIKPKSFKTKL